MKKEIKSKLEKLSKEELIDIIRKLCEIPEVEKVLKLIVNPSKRDIERELSSFERWCSSVANNPCSERAENGLYTSASLIWKAIDYLDANTAAGVLYEMYDLSGEITEYSEIAVDINCESRCYLENILKDNQDAFSEQELKKYEYITDV